MTPARLRVLDYIREQISRVGVAPTYREITDALGLGTISTARDIVERLITGGFLARRPGHARSLTITGTPDLRTSSTAALQAELARRGATMAALDAPARLAFAHEATCAATSCGIAVKPGMLMCRSHWFDVPIRLRTSILEAFRAKRVAEYQEYVRQAVDLVDGFGA